MSKTRRSDGGPSDATPRPTPSQRQDRPADGPSGHRPRPTPSQRQDAGPAEGPSGHRPRPAPSQRQDGGPADGPSGHRPRPAPFQRQDGGPARAIASPRQDGGPSDDGPSGNRVCATQSPGEGRGPSDSGPSDNGSIDVGERRLDPADGTVQTFPEMLQKYAKHNFSKGSLQTYFREYCMIMRRAPDLRSSSIRGSLVPPGRDPRMERRHSRAALRNAKCKAMPSKTHS